MNSFKHALAGFTGGAFTSVFMAVGLFLTGFFVNGAIASEPDYLTPRDFSIAALIFGVWTYQGGKVLQQIKAEKERHDRK